MPIYTSDELMYTCFGTLFDRMLQMEPASADSFVKSGLAIRFTCSNPAAVVTFDGSSRPLRIDYGHSTVKPQIEVTLAADTMHCILLGEMGIRKSIGAGLLDLKGPIWKTSSLADLFRNAQTYYPAVLQEYGLSTQCPPHGRK